VLGVASAEFWSDVPDHPGRQWRDIVPLVESGAVDPPIGAVHPLADAAAAIRELEERRAAGRVLVRMR
jgi:NADPH2:quinone reductase